MKKLILAAMIASTTGCASPPESIKPITVNPASFNAYSCEEIKDDATRITIETNRLHSILSEKASTDAVQMTAGLIVLWPALLFLEGGDGVEANEYSYLKGQSIALQAKADEMGCKLPSNFKAATVKPVESKEILSDKEQRKINTLRNHQ